MSIDSKALVEEGTPRYLASGDPDLADYYLAWLDNIADDATVEGSMLDGAVQGPEGVRAIVTAIRAFYGDSQEFHFTGPWGDSGWLEDHVARVDDKPLGCVVLITRNTPGLQERLLPPGPAQRGHSSPAGRVPQIAPRLEPAVHDPCSGAWRECLEQKGCV